MPVQPSNHGRFADPENACPKSDPRINPELLKGLIQAGLASHSQKISLDRATSSKEALIKASHEVENSFTAVFESVASHDTSGVDHSLEQASNPEDDFKIDLHIHRPSGFSLDKPLPAVAYMHGGGMVTLRPYNSFYKSWAHALARQGLIIINVAFRNANEASSAGGEGFCHFPVGLNDCVAALRWIDSHRSQLGVSTLAVLGESGGANLALASTMKLLRDGDSKVVDGVYGMVPYISGVYHKSDEWKIEHGLASLVECDGYFIDSSLMGLFTILYDPGDEHATNPLAWPWHAKEKDLEGFPPTVITVNELDPLRDEGMDMVRKLWRAGVHVVGRMNMGILHDSDQIEPWCPDFFKAAVGDIKRFCNSLTESHTKF